MTTAGIWGQVVTIGIGVYSVVKAVLSHDRPIRGIWGQPSQEDKAKILGILDPKRAYCDKAPPGWWCSREPLHEGPCAARHNYLTLAKVMGRNR